jgi:hypothetical protein
MAAIPGLGLLGLLLCGYKIGRRHVIQLLLGSVIILALLTLIDTLRNPAQQSHIGQVAGQISQGGYGYAGQIILRKIQMNLGLITGKAGSTVILCLIPAFALWIYILRDRSLRVMNLHPWLREAAKAAALTVPLALLFNDSGIVPAAIITASVVMPWLWLMLGEGENS